MSPATEPLTPVGPSLWGRVWQAADSSTFYRVLPIEQVSGPARQEIRGWVGRPARPGIARIAEAGQRAEDRTYVIGYQAQAARPLTEQLEVVPLARLDVAIALLTSFPGWSATVGGGFLPSPADLVLMPDGTPCLLPMPARPEPDIRVVLDEPVLAWHLAPELLRGLEAGSPEAADRYALGMTAMRLFGRPEPCPAAELLPRLATGTALQTPGLHGLLPFWMQRLEMSQRLRAGIEQLLDPDPAARLSVDLGALATQLAGLREWTDPRRAVIWLRGANRHATAHAVLLDALLDADEPYELLLDGAELVADALGRPLEAVQLLERAITVDPARPTAYERQLYLLLGILGTGELDLAPSAAQRHDATSARLDDVVERDFERLPPEYQNTVEEQVAWHLLRRGRYERALRLIRPRLMEDGAWRWWRFGLNIAYATALLQVGRVHDAADMAARIRERLERARVDRSMPPSELVRSALDLAELEERIRRQAR
jgi:hypothetical protein